MPRLPVALSLFALSVAPAASADQVELADEVASVLITGNISDIDISVRNMSGSPDANQRALEVVSAPPVVGVDGQVWCSAGSTLDHVELMFGPLAMFHGPDPFLLDWGVWDVSAPLGFGNVDDADFSIEHELDFAHQVEPWNLFTDFNPAEIVEAHLETYVDNGGSVVDFLRTDDVFEASITVSAVAWCTDDSDDGVAPGFRSRPIRAYIFYHGDRSITEQPVVGTPGDIATLPEPPPLGIGTSAPAPTPPEPTSRRR